MTIRIPVRDQYRNRAYLFDKFFEFCLYWETRKINPDGKITVLENKQKNEEILKIKRMAGSTNMPYEDYPFFGCNVMLHAKQIVALYSVHDEISINGIDIDKDNCDTGIHNLIFDPKYDFNKLLSSLMEKHSYSGIYTSICCDFFKIIGNLNILEIEPSIDMVKYLKKASRSAHGVSTLSHSALGNFFIPDKYIEIKPIYKIRVEFALPHFGERDVIEIGRNKLIQKEQFKYTRNFEIFDEIVNAEHFGGHAIENHRIKRRFLIFDRPILYQLFKSGSGIIGHSHDDILRNIYIYYNDTWQDVIPGWHDCIFARKTLYFMSKEKIFIYGFVLPIDYAIYIDEYGTIIHEKYECMKKPCEYCDGDIMSEDSFSNLSLHVVDKENFEKPSGIYAFSKFISEMKNLKISSGLEDRIMYTEFEFPNIVPDTKMSAAVAKEIPIINIKFENRNHFKQSYLYKHAHVLLYRWLSSHLESKEKVQKIEYKYIEYTNEYDLESNHKCIINEKNNGKYLLMSDYYVTWCEEHEGKYYHNLIFEKDSEKLEKFIEKMEPKDLTDEIKNKKIDFVISGDKNTYVIMISDGKSEIDHNDIKTAMCIGDYYDEYENTSYYIFEINANWILSQIGQPDVLLFKCIEKPEFVKYRRCY